MAERKTRKSSERSAKSKTNGRGRASSAARGISFSDYLARVSALIAKHGSSLELRPPAKAEELAKLEALPGVQVPDELRAAWRTSNGCEHHLFSRPRYLTGYAFLSVAEAIRARSGFAARAPRYAGYEERGPRDPRIAPGWYEPGWLPFAAFGGSTLVLFVDASPSTRGRSGQIIAFTHDPDEITYVAPSFPEFLGGSLRWIEANPEDVLGLS